jgi:hypothetical protein
VAEFRSTSQYDSWLADWGDDIEIIDVSTQKRWSLWSGFLGDSKTYSVTFQGPEDAVPSTSNALALAVLGTIGIVVLILILQYR